MHVLKAPGVRVVASPEAIESAEWQDAGPGREHFEPLILRFAPDEAFAIGATGVRIDDPNAITEAEVGYVAMMFPVDEFIDFVVPRIEWPSPATRPAFAQGSIAGVPAKLWLLDDTFVVLYTSEAYARELAARLGWLR